MRFLHRCILSLIAAVLVSCGGPAGTLSQPNIPAPDYWPTSGWRNSSPEQQGIDSGKLADLMDDIGANATNLHSLLVIRNGYIVLEAYADPYGPEVRHTVESNTKSVVGTLIGIAIDQGKIENTQQRMVDFFPYRMHQNSNDLKKSITLGHLLSMTSGLDCADQTEQARQMYADHNWVGYLLDLPTVASPGKEWAYCSGSVHILSAILQATTGSSARAFANQNLFQPLGIPEVSEQDWMPDPKGISNGIAGLYLTPQELAKYGLLYLQRGRWDGKQIVSAQWVDESTSSKISIGKDDYAAGLNRQFGYLFSIFPDQEFYGYLGMAGQDMFIVPNQNLVVVFNSGLKVGEEGSLLRLLTGYILPSIQSGSLPANPEKEKRLSSALQRFAGLEQPVQSLSKAALAANQKVYHFDRNPLGWTSLAFSFTEGAKQATITLDDAIKLQAGLDHRYRLNEMPNSRPVGLRGSWVTPESFNLDYITLGEFLERTVNIQFSEDEIICTIQDKNYGGEPLQLLGKVR